MNIIMKTVFGAFVGALLVSGQVAYAQQAPFCSPSVQVANVNDFVNFSATGTNDDYYWLAANGIPVEGEGSSFGTRFSMPGDHVVVLTSNGRNSLCLVRVNGGFVLGVSDVSTGPEDVALWALVVGLVSALAIYRVLSPKLRLRK